MKNFAELEKTILNCTDGRRAMMLRDGLVVVNTAELDASHWVSETTLVAAGTKNRVLQVLELGSGLEPFDLVAEFTLLRQHTVSHLPSGKYAAPRLEQKPAAIRISLASTPPQELVVNEANFEPRHAVISRAAQLLAELRNARQLNTDSVSKRLRS